MISFVWGWVFNVVSHFIDLHLPHLYLIFTIKVRVISS